MGILAVTCGTKKIDEHFMLACSRDAYQIVLLRKVVGALIGVGVLKRMNTVHTGKAVFVQYFWIQPCNTIGACAVKELNTVCDLQTFL